MKKVVGRLTLPSEANFYEETKKCMDLLGADALRDSDGTKLPEDIKDLDAKIYTTYFVAREYNDFAKQNMDEVQQFYLMTEYNTATSSTLEIPIMKGYFREQVRPDYKHDPHKWWEVIDRTAGEVVPTDNWEVDEKNEQVIVKNAKEFHQYTLSFLADAIWDTTSMYNHITNDWGDREHQIPFNMIKPNSSKFMEDQLEKWLKENTKTDVVRFTTFFYHFTIVFNEEGKEKFVDWFGYSQSVSPELITEFEKKYGYKFRPEFIVDEGYYNSPFRIPSKEFKDYQEFVQLKVTEKAKKLVDKVHAAGKEAMMFLGDNWIGTEPHGEYFKNIGLDAVVGSVGDGVTLRIISDIEDVKYTEGRFLPYFFPDTFYEGNDPTIEARHNWLTARRAIMRKPINRIGYGGYLSLAYKFPKFMDYIAKVADEFRSIIEIVENNKSYSSAKVAVLNCWGKIRAWQPYIVAHGKWYKLSYSYMGMMEALSGMDMDVHFINFEDVKNGRLKEFDVIINAGDAYTAFSGGDAFKDEKVLSEIRKYVYNGGGIIGIGEPSAYQREGKFFQLHDIFGLDKELGFGQSTNKYFDKTVDKHFITEDCVEDFEFGESTSNVFATSENTEIIEYSNNEVHMATNQYGKGRAFYMAGMPHSLQNNRILKRAIHYVANKEKELYRYFAQDTNVEVAAYPEAKKYAILNNSDQEIITNVYDGNGNMQEVKLDAAEIKWIDEV